jgi:hypothetical protein
MSNVETLRLAESGPVEEVVALLREVLARAEAGEVIGVGVAMACAGRCDATAYAVGDGNIATLVLSCERLKARLLSVGEEAL